MAMPPEGYWANVTPSELVAWLIAGKQLETMRRGYRDLPLALIGDDRPAPDGDAWETQMLSFLAEQERRERITQRLAEFRRRYLGEEA